MKYALLCLLYSFTAVRMHAQKPPVDFETGDGWLRPSNPVVSNDGRYVVYLLSKAGEMGKESSLVIQATDNSWKQKIDGGMSAAFTSDSHFCLYRIGRDTLGIFSIANGEQKKVVGVRSFKTSFGKAGQWLGYLMNSKELVLDDLSHGTERRFPAVEDYMFSDKGDILLLREGRSMVVRQDLADGGGDTVLRIDGTITAMTMDSAGLRVAMMEKESKGGAGRIWYYSQGMDSARVWMEGKDLGPGYELASNGYGSLHLPSFSADGKRLFFLVKRQVDTAKENRSGIITKGVDVWTYRDPYLQEQQLKTHIGRPVSEFVAVKKMGDGKCILLTGERDDPGTAEMAPDGDHLLIIHQSNEVTEMNQRLVIKPSLYLVSAEDGSRKVLTEDDRLGEAHFSPGGKYIVWFDAGKKNYCSYSMDEGVIRNITGRMPVAIYDATDDRPQPAWPFPVSTMPWLRGDAGLLINDRYDLWLVDPAGRSAPVNMTNGYGRKHGILLRYAWGDTFDGKSTVTVDRQTALLLAGFDENNKDNGFFRKRLDRPGDPEKLTLGPYIYYLPVLSVGSLVYSKTAPVKARDAEGYVVSRMGAAEYPNLYFTRDFKVMAPLTDLHPQRSYNWLTAELMHWKKPDGSRGQAILYKPEDFNPQKRYPVIFYYYQRLTEGLNQFIYPEPSDGTLNIPWFVSHGYLVVLPDIWYRIGQTGESVRETVVSAAEWLARQPWVDGKHMGLEGHSFGGYETNYLVAHTHLFAAAVSSAGICDLIGLYGSTRLGGTSSQSLEETNQGRLGVALWDNPRVYIDNSPIFRADSVSTPLLINHNTSDPNVPFAQGLEWFTALRRLNKPVWMLQYDKEGHLLGNEKDRLDFSIRMAQFFDHFLKGAPMPRWMEEGVPAGLKGIDSGLEMTK